MSARVAKALRRMRGCSLGTAFLAVVLAGCAGTAPHKPVTQNRAAWQSRRARLMHLQQWTLRARAGSGGVFGWSGSVLWRQTGARFDIGVSGPLGMGALRIQGTPQALVVNKGGRRYVTRDPDRFFERRLHLTFPVAGLRYWALGLPEPGTPAQVTVDDKGRLVRLEQAGWTLRYRQYRQVGAYQLPQKLSGERGETHIKMVVQDWSQLR